MIGLGGKMAKISQGNPRAGHTAMSNSRSLQIGDRIGRYWARMKAVEEAIVEQ